MYPQEKLCIMIPLQKQKDKITLSMALLSVGILYITSLKNDLVADDWVFLYPHSFLETFAYFYKSIIPPEWKAQFLRPVPMFLFWLDTKIWPGTVWGPHLINILFHVINMYLIWSLVRFMKSETKTRPNDVNGGLPALAASMAYGMHPLAVGSVAWVSARFDVLVVTFGLFGLLIWLRWDAGLIKGGKAIAGALLLLLTALLSKEQGIVFIIACGFVSLIRLIRTKKLDHHFFAFAALILLIVFYMIYRFIIFKGLGGYLFAFYGPSIKIPFYYFCAVLFPFLNASPDWVFSWTLALSMLVLAVTFMIMWNMVSVGKNKYLLFPFIAMVIFIAGLLTTAPYSWMTLDKVLYHLESRYALIPVVGFALLTGFFVHMVIRSFFIHRIVLVMTFIMGVAGAWRSDVQIQSWGKAGLIADNIISQTLELVPNPPPDSHLIFVDIPRITPQYAYVFGIGLAEALKYKYGRTDITVIRYPKKRDVRTANPERDYVFQYHPPTGRLEVQDIAELKVRK